MLDARQPVSSQPMAASWSERYGAWALVAGASEGLGAAFAAALAARGIHLVLMARRAEPLEDTARALRDAHGVEIDAHAVDLADPTLPALLERIGAEREVGVGIYNAAYSPIGDFAARPLEDLLRVIDVNVRGPVTFARTLAPPMVERGRGGLVLVSSLAGLQGSPRIATYAASKAFNTVLAEGLWGELRPSGVDVLACCAGAGRTPGYTASAATTSEAPGTLDPAVVAERTLAALGRGPRVVPGGVNKLASLLVGRWLPRRTAVSIIAKNTADLEEGR